MNLSTLPSTTPYRATLDAAGHIVRLTLTVAEDTYVVLTSPRSRAVPVARTLTGTLGDHLLAALAPASAGGPLAEVVASVIEGAAKGPPAEPQQ